MENLQMKEQVLIEVENFGTKWKIAHYHEQFPLLPRCFQKLFAVETSEIMSYSSFCNNVFIFIQYVFWTKTDNSRQFCRQSKRSSREIFHILAWMLQVLYVGKDTFMLRHYSLLKMICSGTCLQRPPMRT